MLKSRTLATFGLGALLATAASAAPVARHTTTVNVDRPIVVGGRTLAAGVYSLERVDSSVVALSKDGKFITLVQVELVSRRDVGPTVVTLRKGASASQLDRWFVNGERTGVQFKS